jgi:hypothetical protein
MLHFSLVRAVNHPDYTAGMLLLEGIPFCSTLELPWRENQRNVSRIPEGDYHVFPRFSQRHGHAFWLQDVPGRQDILIHSGNTTADTQGCILVGEGWRRLSQAWLMSSRAAMTRLRGTVEEAAFFLTVS